VVRSWLNELAASAFKKDTKLSDIKGWVADSGEGRWTVQEAIDLDLKQIAALWNHGSVVRSWLLELLERAYAAEGQDLERIRGWVADSGEGRWTVQTAIDLDVPAPVITLSLMARFRSRQDESYAAQVIAALRNQFGGHAVRTDPPAERPAG
jgi:6-phosphogluconate dehydrogenase